eukprot:GHVL01014821.1.p1 GENE.GHVL01014821.1~~GHVL01014821.1.p1  ORF type:complete len:246 (+),score=48.51 GHVL01014821.1:38-775(+)
MEKQDELRYSARLAEQSERYDEMTKYMSEIAQMGNELTTEERNLLSVAFKNGVGARRASWRILSSIEQKERGRGNQQFADYAKSYRLKVEKELDDICEEILRVLDDHLIKSATTAEAKVFYHKMKGDYYRYISEFSAEQKRTNAASKAHDVYKEASDIAAAELPTTHPIRLGLALNFSVFHFEILNNPDEACKTAKKAFEEALGELESVSEDTYKDSTLIMQLLRDNLTLWTSDEQAQPENAEAT